MMNTRETFLTYCREYIKNHIEEFVGQVVYAADLGLELTDAPNIDGSLTYSRYDAMEYLKEWWWEASDYFDYEKLEFGAENIHNPFENPEAYMVCMVIEGVNSLINQCSVIEENWNEQIELTQEISEQICKEIEELEITWVQ